VSTVEPQTHQAIPFEAFVDAVEKYVADSETDDEGDQMNA
jgi:cation transport regulator ChaB